MFSVFVIIVGAITLPILIAITIFIVIHIIKRRKDIELLKQIDRMSDK